MQTAETGRQARKNGYRYATMVALHIGATQDDGQESNEFMFYGAPIAIKCSGGSAPPVVVTDKMAERVKVVYCAHRDRTDRLVVWLEVRCGNCTRSGRRRIDKLIDEHGRDMSLPDLRKHLVGDCVHRSAARRRDQCQVFYPQLRELRREGAS